MQLLPKLLVFGSFAAAIPSKKCNAGGTTALYFMSNRAEGNHVHALPVSSTGLVKHGTGTPTGGLGSRAPSMFGLTDALNSQGSIAIMDNFLFVVNAGSNTLSMMEIDCDDPLKLKVVGKPVHTVGDWPNAVAVSKELMTACVSNSGTNSGIACFSITESGLKPDGKAFRSLPLSPKQDTPPNGPFNTVSQVFFSKDMTALYSTVKGTPVTNATNTGYLAFFPIKNGVVSTKQVRSSPEGTAVLFGSVSLPDDTILATDASFGAALLKVNKAGVASTVLKTAIPRNAATCWAVQSPATGLIYTSDDGIDQIGAFDPKNGKMVALTLLKVGIPNLIELTARGDLLYALSHGNSTVPPHVIVMKTLGSSGKIKSIQEFAPSNVGLNVEGLALL